MARATSARGGTSTRTAATAANGGFEAKLW